MRDQRMTAQQPDFEIGQRRRFLKEFVGQRRLAEIVQERRAFERGQGPRREVEDGAEQPRHLGDAHRMGHRARIAPLHQRAHRRLHAHHHVVVRHLPAGLAEVGGAAHHRVLEREAGLAILGGSLAPADGAGDSLRDGAARDRRGNLFDDVPRTLDAAAPPSGPAEHDDREVLAQRFQLAGEAAGVPRRRMIGHQRHVGAIVFGDRERFLGIARAGAVVALPLQPGRQRGLQGGFGFDYQNVSTHNDFGGPWLTQERAGPCRVNRPTGVFA